MKVTFDDATKLLPAAQSESPHPMFIKFARQVARGERSVNEAWASWCEWCKRNGVKPVKEKSDKPECP